MTDLSRAARTVEKRHISRANITGREVTNISRVDVNFKRCATNAHMSVRSCNYNCNCGCKELVKSSRAVNPLRIGRITKNSLSTESP